MLDWSLLHAGAAAQVQLFSLPLFFLTLVKAPSYAQVEVFKERGWGGGWIGEI